MQQLTVYIIIYYIIYTSIIYNLHNLQEIMKENLDPTFNGVFDLLLVATDTVETGKEQGIILSGTRSVRI